MNYFERLIIVEDIKFRYRRLAMAHHPDRGGSVEIMQEINRQYQQLLESCDKQTNADGRTYSYDETVERDIMDKIDELLKAKMDDVEINLIGVWIWITGETRIHRKKLKSFDCRWNGKRGFGDTKGTKNGGTAKRD